MSSRGFPMAKSDEFKSLERDRLRPCDLKTTSPSALQQYDDYLHWFYYSHRDPAPVASLADAASMVTRSILCLSLGNQYKVAVLGHETLSEICISFK
jgi:hypothetical protein